MTKTKAGIIYTLIIIAIGAFIIYSGNLSGNLEYDKASAKIERTYPHLSPYAKDKLTLKLIERQDLHRYAAQQRKE